MEDRAFRSYFEGETQQLPSFYTNLIQKDLGAWWPWLPQGALTHDPNAYLQKTENRNRGNAAAAPQAT